ncbi:uncharacterized protein LOC119770075 [Culex quinquefasciatus]|uniref:uncharacterized protein LOC119770075 n=1 Tax=Culex quinquefasciatus TaxID=7176 RepID=UPI0018E377A4|nr:uncharacterized protein LOC119770075 [Culex quinquefasciatus]
MVRVYLPENAKTGSVSVEASMKALRERRRGVPLRKVAKKYGLSKSSLQWLESKLKKDPNCVLRKRGGQPALSANGEQDELNDLGELGEPGPEADCALSEDEQDELGENDDELDNVDTLNELEPGVGSWVLVKFVYGKRDSRHIGKITSKAGGDYLGSFLRKSTKKSDIFVFPDVSDERAFASQDVIITLKEPSVRRGRYSFEPNPLI